jgi:1,2-diacylglycerol 3-alpha-glucosyltransferase
VFSSLTDTQGLVILEAIASGLPVVALKDDAFKGMAVHDKNGVLIEPAASPRRFAARVAALLDDRGLCREFSRNSVRIAQGFGEEEQAEKLIRLYQSLVSRHASQAQRAGPH